jgi:hypothetical protein
MEKWNITMQIKEMANFIMHVLVEFVFSDSYMYFALSLNAIIIKLHDEAIYIYWNLICHLKDLSQHPVHVVFATKFLTTIMKSISCNKIAVYVLGNKIL